MGELVVVTGPSHVGKSTLIGALLERVNRPAGIVSIDETIGASEWPPSLRWEFGLDAAYAAAAARAVELLRQGSLVFYESTFTYVPPGSRPSQLHLEQLSRLLEMVRRVGGDALVVHLIAPLAEIEKRRRQTRRLTGHIVEETWRHHAGVALEAPRLLRIDTSEKPADAAAAEVLGCLR